MFTDILNINIKNNTFELFIWLFFVKFLSDLDCVFFKTKLNKKYIYNNNNKSVYNNNSSKKKSNLLHIYNIKCVDKFRILFL